MNSPQRPNANTLVFVPCFNEAENVTPLIAKISEVAPTADILFCDDNSPDGTGEVLQGLQSQYPRLQLMRRAGKLGVGSAHLDGIRYALAHGYTHLVTMDCDFTHSPEDIPRLLDAAKDADIVVGSRFLSEDSLPGWTAYRRTMTRVGHQVTSTLLGIPNDATTAFRVYRLDRINPRLFDHFTERGYAFFLHSLHHAIRHGYQIVDVSIVLPARTYGHSKMSVREIARSVQQIAALAGQRTVDPQALPLSRTDEGDPQNGSEWDAYWEAAKAPTLAYSVAATAYRNLFIKPNLTRVMNDEFAPGARLLHAGCGSGQVDSGITGRFAITAVDLSPAALRRYRRENPGVRDVQRADILALPFADGVFDGAYNLGVLEHFSEADAVAALNELRRVTSPGGKVVVFWPHRFATSGLVLDTIHFVARDVLGGDLQLHPPEHSRMPGRAFAEQVFHAARMKLTRYEFGPRDLFVQAIAVGEVQ